MSSLRGRLALDASIVIEILAGSSLVKNFVKAIVRGEVEACTSRLSLVEAMYITCRLWGEDIAQERIRVLLDSGAIEVVEDEEIWEYAADCKCKIPVSLGDCHTLALAKKYRIRPLFLRPEKELVENLDRIRKWLGTTPFFLLQGE